MQDEQVLCFRKSLLDQVGLFDGFKSADPKYNKLLTIEDVYFLPRSVAETDFASKQLIPYNIFWCKNEAANTVSVFNYVRGKTSGESRLVKKRSIGIGGHISPRDKSPLYSNRVYEFGRQREIQEEVDLAHSGSIKECLCGYINDDSNGVGRVHFGVVHLCEVESPVIRSREEEVIEEGFLTLAELKERYNELENWSKICLDNIFQQQ
jgi:predicted NUDIX family phosphoesterase